MITVNHSTITHSSPPISKESPSFFYSLASLASSVSGVSLASWVSLVSWLSSLSRSLFLIWTLPLIFDLDRLLLCPSFWSKTSRKFTLGVSSTNSRLEAASSLFRKTSSATVYCIEEGSTYTQVLWVSKMLLLVCMSLLLGMTSSPDSFSLPTRPLLCALPRRNPTSLPIFSSSISTQRYWLYLSMQSAAVRRTKKMMRMTSSLLSDRNDSNVQLQVRFRVWACAAANNADMRIGFYFIV